MLSDAFALLPCFIFNLRIPLSIFCKAGALMTKSLGFLLFLKDFIYSSFSKDNFAKYNNIGLQVFVVILNI